MFQRFPRLNIFLPEIENLVVVKLLNNDGILSRIVVLSLYQLLSLFIPHVKIGFIEVTHLESFKR